MNDELRIRYEKLKEKNKEHILRMRWNKNVMLQECFFRLGKETYVVSLKKKRN